MFLLISCNCCSSNTKFNRFGYLQTYILALAAWRSCAGKTGINMQLSLNFSFPFCVLSSFIHVTWLLHAHQTQVSDHQYNLSVSLPIIKWNSSNKEQNCIVQITASVTRRLTDHLIDLSSIEEAITRLYITTCLHIENVCR